MAAPGHSSRRRGAHRAAPAASATEFCGRTSDVGRRTGRVGASLGPARPRAERGPEQAEMSTWENILATGGEESVSLAP
ncbi:hypothetical protein [Brachybacterium sacelli]|uniref:hypothetical protein n=1 Tax=Brachybacterium sacelli TaxID=173364 RepID=UPI003622FF70